MEDEPRLAQLLGDCRLRVWHEDDEWLALIDKLEAHCHPLVSATLIVPAELYTEAQGQMGRIGGVLEEAIGRLDRFYIEPGPAREWSNQGAGFDRTDAPHVWCGMRFRSHSEVEIAGALERADVDFLPNCMARQGKSANDRRNFEIDFLIIDKGRIGILEVDGSPWHPAKRAALEHRRDRRFRRDGCVVERFDSEECRTSPDDVVATFMDQLREGCSCG
ncbi:MAG: hypothetical protein QOF85_1000 [Solirubrobacterales bacterium]|nr:hypothetical protein [Solirubrobacterales bacterium]